MIQGEVYGKFVRDNHEWRLEKRKILDISNTTVLYEIIRDEEEGTQVESDFIPHQLCIQEWNNWCQTAVPWN